MAEQQRWIVMWTAEQAEPEVVLTQRQGAPPTQQNMTDRLKSTAVPTITTTLTNKSAVRPHTQQSKEIESSAKSLGKEREKVVL